jgi:uncharacterized protein DUF4055
MASDAASLPSYKRPEATAVGYDLQLIDDLLAGSRRMWDQSATGSGGKPYIRKWSDEAPPVYDVRRMGETVFEGLGRTLSAAVGMLFAKPPQVTWNASETAMTEIWANIDAAGTAGPVLTKRFAESAIRDGLAAILVDHPQPPKLEETPLGAVTNDVAAKLGLRPTWALYRRSQIINWRTAVINNRKALSMVVFSECGEAEDGLFGIRTVQRYRVLRLILTPAGYQATWKLYEVKADANGSDVSDFVDAGGGVYKNREGAIADFLPVSIAYTGRTDAPMCATIPLLGVAFANLAHWQASTDLRFYRSLSAFPQPVVIGSFAQDATGQAGKLRVGPMVGIHLQGDGAKFEWAEISGTSMAQLESGIKEKLAQMGQLGLSFLVSDTRAAETADAKRLDATAENSTLATAAQGIDDAENSALEHTAWYLGIDKAGAPVLAINRDFESILMDAQTITAYVALVNAGFPKRQVLEALQAGGRIKPDADLDTLEEEWSAGLAAAQELKASQAAAALDAKTNGDPTPLAA